jgi:hypothetical protein
VYTQPLIHTSKHTYSHILSVYLMFQYFKDLKLLRINYTDQNTCIDCFNISYLKLLRINYTDKDACIEL